MTPKSPKNKQHETERAELEDIRTIFPLLTHISTKKIGHAEIKILSCLAGEMILNNSTTATLSQSTISEKTAIAKPNVSRSIKRLKNEGYIEVFGQNYKLLL